MCIIKKHEAVNDNPAVGTNVDQIENRFTSMIMTGFYLDLLNA